MSESRCPGSPDESVPPAESERSRRSLLALTGAGSAAALAGLLTHETAWAGHDATNVFHLGVANSNPAGTQTALLGSGSSTDDAVLTVDAGDAADQSAALQVYGRTGMRANGEAPALAVAGDPTAAEPNAIQVDGMTFFGADEDGAAFFFNNLHLDGTAISAVARGQMAIRAAGVEGKSGPGVGIQGVSSETPNGDGIAGPGVGVQGFTGSGIGVEAVSESGGDALSVRSELLSGRALVVDGRAAFNSAGTAVLPAGRNKVFVPVDTVTALSHITVTFTGDPGSRVVHWIERKPGGNVGFILHCTTPVGSTKPATPFSFLVVEPG